ncbi:protein of unknown function [Legionella longbeachae NSW150]|uniref:Uncharacterized protein n=1 Tax=Legionella longbeachae serogroup 1 (strain NSW150) TaxID=661367 RepID=D3HLC4_LEGLN|nr:protein of unknown function [Legionella longbeachae NSW150]
MIPGFLHLESEVGSMKLNLMELDVKWLRTSICANKRRLSINLILRGMGIFELPLIKHFTCLQIFS